MRDAGTAAVLLYVAYVVYRWGSRIDSGATVSEEASSYPPRPPGYDVPFSLDEFVEQGEFVEQEPFSTPYDEKGGYEQGGYEQVGPRERGPSGVLGFWAMWICPPQCV